MFFDDVRRRIGGGGLGLPDISSPVTPPFNPASPSIIPGGRAMPPSPIEYEPPTRKQRYEVEKEGFMRGTPGRGKSALLNALRGAAQGLATGGGLGAALGGAVSGGAFGAIAPRQAREMEFNQRRRPEILQQFALEDTDRAAQRQAGIDELNAQHKIAEIGAINRSNLPRPIPPRAPVRSDRGLYDVESGQIIKGTEPLPEQPKDPTPQYRFGRNKKTGRFAYFNVANKAEAAEHDPAPPLQRPRAVGAAKPKKEQKFASMDDVRAAAEKAGVSANQMAAKFREKGYQIETRR